LHAERVGQEKRARLLETRPEPTSNGNCSSWNFIVGKKGVAYIRERALDGSLQASNIELIYMLSTAEVDHSLNNLWVICGAPVDGGLESRIVEEPLPLMRDPAPKKGLFYRKSSL